MKVICAENPLENNMIEEIEENYPNAIVLEPRKQYDKTILGVDLNGRVIYSYREIINMHINEEGMIEEDAIEFFDFNTRGTFESMTDPNRPIFDMYR